MSRYTQFRVPRSLIQEICQAETIIIKKQSFTNNQESYPKLGMSKGKSTEATHSTSHWIKNSKKKSHKHLPFKIMKKNELTCPDTSYNQEN